MSTGKLSYHRAADRFLESYSENNLEDNFFFTHRFMSHFAGEAKKIAKSEGLDQMDYQNVMVASWFRFAGVCDIGAQRNGASIALLNDFFRQINYPHEARMVVENAIIVSVESKTAETIVEKVVCDAANSRFAIQNLQENIILLKEEVNRIADEERSELFYLRRCIDGFINNRYYTEYAKNNYSLKKENNFRLLEKKINQLEKSEKTAAKEKARGDNSLLITNKETEDLFKIAFRNYNHLISVADSKAALLINVTSIIISVILAFVISRIDKYIYLLWPSAFLLSVCAVTLFLSVLASKPQKNSFSEDKQSKSYQKFFFGSFDLIDPSFHKASWATYQDQLNELFSGTKEVVYQELYKESFNVRKVLSKKFHYLSVAYWIFIIGLFLSVLLFVFAIKN